MKKYTKINEHQSTKSIILEGWINFPKVLKITNDFFSVSYYHGDDKHRNYSTIGTDQVLHIDRYGTRYWSSNSEKHRGYPYKNTLIWKLLNK